MLKGQDKKDYQRKYMRLRRANVRPIVRPNDTGYPDMSNPAYAEAQKGAGIVLDPAYIDADGHPVYDE